MRKNFTPFHLFFKRYSPRYFSLFAFLSCHAIGVYALKDKIFKYLCDVNIHCSMLEENQNEIYVKKALDSVVVIQDKQTGATISHGMIITDSGHVLTILNPLFENQENLHQKILIKNLSCTQTYTFKIADILTDENILILKLDQFNGFKKAELQQALQRGQSCAIVYQSNFFEIRKGVISEPKIILSHLANFSQLELPFPAAITNLEIMSSSLYGLPVFNKKTGESLGMLYPVASPLEKHGVLMPCSFINGIAKQLETGSSIKRPYIGISTMKSSTGNGLFVMNVSPTGPAAKSGIKVGDVITTIDGVPILNNNDLLRVTSFDIGKAHEFVIQDEDRKRSSNLKVYTIQTIS